MKLEVFESQRTLPSTAAAFSVAEHARFTKASRLRVDAAVK
jgi:hypothetical protein